MSAPRRWLSLGGFLLLMLGVSAMGGWATASSVRSWYPTLIKPEWTPPSAVFGPVWTILYVLIAIVGWRLWQRRQDSAVRPALRAWWVQLALNALWSPAFFGLRNPLAGLLVIVPLWLTLLCLQRALFRVDRPSAWMWLPYLLWVSYATALNTALWWLN